MKYGVDKFLVELSRFAGIEQGVIDVGRPVVKGGEQEAQFRCGDGLSDGAVKFVVAREIPQLHLARLHRAYAADDIGKHLVGGVRLHLVILSPAGDVVCVMGQQQ